MNRLKSANAQALTRGESGRTLLPAHFFERCPSGASEGAPVKMSKAKAATARRAPSEARKQIASTLRTRHLRREVKTALELAVAALAHAEVIDRLATAAGLLDALAEFPQSSAPVLATLPRAVEMAEGALDDWRNWQARPARRRTA